MNMNRIGMLSWRVIVRIEKRIPEMEAFELRQHHVGCKRRDPQNPLPTGLQEVVQRRLMRFQAIRDSDPR